MQEALTNALRHAGPARAPACGPLRPTTRCELKIADDGRGGRRRRPTAGHGLVGMRERVRLYGGELDAGPRPDGGFVVRAPPAAAPAT